MSSSCNQKKGREKTTKLKISNNMCLRERLSKREREKGRAKIITIKNND